MADFTPITTQEEFDNAVNERLETERQAVRNEYADYLSPDDEKEKYKGYVKPEDAAAKDKKIKDYETNSLKMKIAHETGLPYELAGRLSGETEDDIRKDAQALSKLIGKGKPTAPLASTEPGGSDVKKAAMKSFTAKLMGKGE